MYYTLKNFDGWKKKTLNCPNEVIDETLQKKKKKKGEMKLFLKKLRLNAF